MEPVYDRKTVIDMGGEFRYRLGEPNVLVLDRAAYRLNGGEEQGPLEILKLDRAVRDALGLPYRGGDMLQPWYAQKFTSSNTPETRAKLNLRFEFEVEVLPVSPVFLAVEHPEAAEYRVNGVKLDPAEAAEDGWVDRCFVKLPVPADALRLGVNRVEMRAEFHRGFDLEALYLLGDFGVRVEGARSIVTELPETIRTGCLTEQGFPFYGGTITYLLDRPAVPSRSEADRALLAVPSFAAACVRVRVPGGDAQLIAWQPYETALPEGWKETERVELDVVLTRRNTFGPLHQIPLLARFYGPDSWTTEGSAFSEDYVLHPAGLLQNPQLILEIPRNS